MHNNQQNISDIKNSQIVGANTNAFLDSNKYDCLDQENDNNKFCFYKTVNVFLLAAVFIILLFVPVLAPRIIERDDLGFDYMGIIVAIFGVLISILITWQIWQTISSQEDIKNIKRVATHLNTLEKQVQELRNAPDAYLFYILADSKFSQREYYDAFDFYSTSVILFIENNVAYNKYSVVALSALGRCLIQASDKDKERFKANSSFIDNKILSIVDAINRNVNQDYSQARRQINDIQNIVKEYGYTQCEEIKEKTKNIKKRTPRA